MNVPYKLGGLKTPTGKAVSFAEPDEPDVGKFDNDNIWFRVHLSFTTVLRNPGTLSFFVSD